MPAEAVAAALVAPSTSPAALLGRSLGRSVRLAADWVGAMADSAESAVNRTLRGRPETRRAPPARLLEELAALVRAQPAGESAALADDDKFWSLIEELHAARHLGVPVEVTEAAGAPQDRAPEERPAVDAAVLDPAAAQPSAEKSAGRKPAAAPKRASRAEADAPEAARAAPAPAPAAATAADEAANPAAKDAAADEKPQSE